MRSTLLVLAITLVGCGDDAAPADLGTPDLAVGDLSQPMCATSCGTCTAGTTCVTNNSNSVNTFAATCLASCQTSADCMPQRSCVEFAGASPSGRYCLSATEPAECGTHCDLVPPTSRCQGSTLILAYHTIVCGLVYVHCANGCVEHAPPDAGDDRQASCL
jgi:hypothetical protein